MHGRGAELPRAIGMRVIEPLRNWSVSVLCRDGLAGRVRLCGQTLGVRLAEKEITGHIQNLMNDLVDSGTYAPNSSCFCPIFRLVSECRVRHPFVCLVCVGSEENDLVLLPLEEK